LGQGGDNCLHLQLHSGCGLGKLGNWGTCLKRCEQEKRQEEEEEEHEERRGGVKRKSEEGSCEIASRTGALARLGLQM